MATKQIIEGARRFKAPEPVEAEGAAPQSSIWTWPLWPGARGKDKYLIEIRPRKMPSW